MSALPPTLKSWLRDYLTIQATARINIDSKVFAGIRKQLQVNQVKEHEGQLWLILGDRGHTVYARLADDKLDELSASARNALYGSEIGQLTFKLRLDVAPTKAPYPRTNDISIPPTGFYLELIDYTLGAHTEGFRPIPRTNINDNKVLRDWATHLLTLSMNPERLFQPGQGPYAASQQALLASSPPTTMVDDVEMEEGELTPKASAPIALTSPDEDVARQSRETSYADLASEDVTEETHSYQFRPPSEVPEDLGTELEDLIYAEAAASKDNAGVERHVDAELEAGRCVAAQEDAMDEEVRTVHEQALEDTVGRMNSFVEEQATGEEEDDVFGPVEILTQALPPRSQFIPMSSDHTERSSPPAPATQASPSPPRTAVKLPPRRSIERAVRLLKAQAPTENELDILTGFAELPFGDYRTVPKVDLDVLFASPKLAPVRDRSTSMAVDRAISPIRQLPPVAAQPVTPTRSPISHSKAVAPSSARSAPFLDENDMMAVDEPAPALARPPSPEQHFNAASPGLLQPHAVEKSASPVIVVEAKKPAVVNVGSETEDESFPSDEVFGGHSRKRARLSADDKPRKRPPPATRGARKTASIGIVKTKPDPSQPLASTSATVIDLDDDTDYSSSSASEEEVETPAKEDIFSGWLVRTFYPDLPNVDTTFTPTTATEVLMRAKRERARLKAVVAKSLVPRRQVATLADLA